ncbi:MAG: hypothetical protein Q9223_005842 [Gallowayella weberi]
MADEKTSDRQEEEVLEKYSVFSAAEKWRIVAMVSYAAWFSTLTSFIYYPAIHQLAQTFAVPVDKINLTITSYMAVATIAPTLLGDAADVLGRRPVYVLALSLYIGANIAIVLSNSYAALVGLRVLQALAISAYEPDECSKLIRERITIAPSIGPILGGSLSYAAGWTWIFWFLCIAAGLCLSVMIFCLPETSRNIVRNGSMSPPRYLRLPISALFNHSRDNDTKSSYTWRIPNPLRSLTIIARRDNAVIILACGILYVVYTCINTSLSVLFIDIYRLTQWQAGLIYLPFGIGGTVSTFFSGHLLDKAYREARTKLGLSTDKAVGDDLANFPIEKARLGIIWTPMLITSCSVLAFGWVLHFHHHIAIPLCLQFIVGLCMQLDFSIYNTLLVDKNYRTPAAAQASSNIVSSSSTTGKEQRGGKRV